MKINARAEFFDLNSVLRAIANGDSASDVMAPLNFFLQSLDVVATIHPFVGIAVLPFRAIVQLELNRRENDRRILTLVSQMADMMQCLGNLPHKRLAEGHAASFDGILAEMKVNVKLPPTDTQADRHHRKVSTIAVTQLTCTTKSASLVIHSRVCCRTSLMSLSTLVRVITSLKWQDKFEEFAEMFANLKMDLHTQVLQAIHWISLETHSVVTSTNAKLDGFDVRLSDIQALLRARTAPEKEIALFLDNNGGPKRSLDDDSFLRRLIKKENRSEEPELRRENRSVRFEPTSRPHRGSRSRHYSRDEDRGATFMPLPPNAPPSPGPPLQIPRAAYSPYSPRAPLTVPTPSDGDYFQVR